MYAFAAAPRLDAKSAYYKRGCSAPRRGSHFLGPLWEGAVGEADWGRENAYYVSPSVTAKGRDTSLAEGGFRSSAPAGAAGRCGHRPLRKDRRKTVCRGGCPHPPVSPSVSASRCHLSYASLRTTQCAPQGYLLRGEHWAAFTQGMLWGHAPTLCIPPERR